MRIITLLFFVLFFFGTSYSQVVTSATKIGTETKQQINTLIGLNIAQYDVDYYKVRYTSKDAKGQADTLSALMTIPITENGEATGSKHPIAFYEHGTAACKGCVPSRYGNGTQDGYEGQVGVILGGLGFIGLLPDYVGMGDGRGFQTYVHDSTSFQASEDLLIAFRAWAENGDAVMANDQLFIAGYSQGGFAGMSFQKGMQDKYGAESVTAAVHGSGPYSLSGTMRDLILVDSSYAYPAYIPNTMLGMNEVYEMYSDLNDFFKPAFVSPIQQYYDGQIRLDSLNNWLIELLNDNFGDTIAHRMIKDDVLNEIENNQSHIINQILRENDVYDWTPESPTRIFYCMADDQVPYQCALVAIDTMYARGADQELVKAVNLGENLDHGGCVEPVMTNAILFFMGLVDIIAGVEEQSILNATIYPNPANNRLFVKTNELGEVNVKIWDISGQLKLDFDSNNLSSGIDLAELSSGMYILQLTSEDNRTSRQKFVVEK